MKQLTEKDVLRIFNEEWNKKVENLVKEVDLALKDSDSSVVSPGLKLKHKDSGILYTIDSIGPRDAILKTPEGDQFIIDGDELSEYELA